MAGPHECALTLRHFSVDTMGFHPLFCWNTTDDFFMQVIMKRLWISLAMFLTGATSALAQAHTCTDFDGTNGTIAVRTVFSVDLKAGETVTAGTTTPTTTNMEIGSTLCGPSFGGGSCQGTQYTAPADQNVTIEVVYSSAGVSGPIGAQYSFTCGAGSVGGGNGSDAATQGANAASIGAGSQSAAAANAINSALMARDSDGGVTATRNSMFLSTMGESGKVSVWGGLSARNFSGTFDGNNIDLVFGADTHVGGNTILGLAGSYGKLDINSLGTTYEANTLAIGPYLQTRLADKLVLRAYAMYGEPDYTVASTAKFSAERLFGGMQLQGEIPVSWAILRPSVGLRGFSEKMPSYTIGNTVVPARNVRQTTANASLRMDFHPGESGVLPYLSIGADFNDFNDGLGTSYRYTSPRVAAGFRIERGTGTFTFDLDGGEIADGANDIGLSIFYNKSF